MPLLTAATLDAAPQVANKQIATKANFAAVAHISALVAGALERCGPLNRDRSDRIAVYTTHGGGVKFSQGFYEIALRRGRERRRCALD